MPLFKSNSMLKWLWITLLIVIVDQITKQWVSHSLQLFHPVEVMPMLNLFLAHNPGAAFSFLDNAGGWQRWLFTLIALAVSGFANCSHTSDGLPSDWRLFWVVPWVT